MTRGQLVLAAAAVLAVALAPVVFAYVQLGYHGDVDASMEYDTPVENAERMLSRSVTESASSIPGNYEWEEREEAVSVVRANLRPRIDTLESARIEDGTVYQVSYNQSAARDWTANCPYGSNREFGSCYEDRGVVVQERAGSTHVLAVAFDVTVTTDRGRTEVVFVVETVS